MTGEPRPQLVELRQAVGDLLAARRRLQGREKRKTGELSLTQSIALVAIDRNGETTAGEIARAAGLNPASVTAMLDQLEKSGIVRRTRSEADRRVVLVSLTEVGRRKLDELREYWDAVWIEKFADVPEEDLVVALALIARIAAMIDDFDPSG